MPIELLWVGGVLVAAITTLIIALLPEKQNPAPPISRRAISGHPDFQPHYIENAGAAAVDGSASRSDVSILDGIPKKGDS